MNSDEQRAARGPAVVDFATGTKLGAVDHAFVDPGARRVVGCPPSTGGRPLSWTVASGRRIDVAEVRSLGPGGLGLEAEASRGAAVNAASGSLPPLGARTGRKVVTEGGPVVGRVTSLVFDVRTYGVAQDEVSAGDSGRQMLVPSDRLAGTGPDLIVVADAVVAGRIPGPLRPPWRPQRAPPVHRPPVPGLGSRRDATCGGERR